MANPMVRWAQALNTTDTAAPTVLSFSPTDNASGVGIASNIVLTFSEPVQRGSGQIYIRTESATGAILASFNAASSGDLSISDRILTINPSQALATGTRYFVTFDAGSIQDMAGNPYAGTSSYDFTTAGVQDTTAPTVLSFSPLNASTGVPPDSPIVLTFSELVQRGSGNITLYIALPQGGGAEVESFDVNASPGLTFVGNTLTITPSANFLTRNYYYLTFDAGSIQDIAGNAYAANSSYKFYTTTQSDFVAPNIAIFSPPDGATGVSLGTNIRLTFDEPIQKGMGVIQIRVGSATGTVLETFDVVTSGSVSISGKVLTLNPSAALAAGTRYFVTIARGSIKDADGNAYAGNNTYDFTTAGVFDNVAPTVTTFSPADGASGVAANSPITLTFSESVQRGSGLLQIRLDSATGTVVESMEAADSNRLSFAGNTLTITPSATLASGSKYFVTVASGAIKDMAGNVYAGTNTYDFMVADTTAPTVTTFAPTDGANGVVVSANIVVTFNEPIQKGTGNIEIRLDSATGTVVETLDAATSRGLNLVGNGLTINPSADLLAGRHYFVTLASGTVKDMVGNAYIGTTTYDFTTADTTAPTVTTFSPADGANVVAPGSAIVLTFNEPVQKGTGTIQIRTGSTTGPLVESLDAATSSNLAFVGNNMTITPVTALLDSTHYFVTIPSGAVKDTVGNAYVGTNTYDFATADTTAPTLTTFSPTDGATGVTGTANLVLTFSEPVGKGIGNIEIRSGSATGTVVETLDVATSSKLTFNGNQLTIDPTV
ncbi:MAG: Ig-like domain-containing protein, partial [Burkholderiaceae bacterium]|nr:Ig-like domain-containing protein [Burkholderiaceae bacterium]